MTVRGAEKAVEAGAAAIVVSNHGGRALPGSAATADVLPEIADAVGDPARRSSSTAASVRARIFSARSHSARTR